VTVLALSQRKRACHAAVIPFHQVRCSAALPHWQPHPGRLSSATTSRVVTGLGASDEHFRKNHGRDLRLGATATPASGGAATSSASTSGGAAAGSSGSAAGSSSAAAAPAQSVDVAAIVDKAVAAKGEKLEWRTSIVDLMKALDIDSSSPRARNCEGTRL